jgi:FAD-linked sulfhydryl oxidase
VHNEVNKRLEKPEFDCAHLDETYDCGCGDEPVASVAAKAGLTGIPGAPRDSVDKGSAKDDITGAEIIKGGR